MYGIEPARYTCYRTNTPIRIDGRPDEPAWALAPKSSAFVDIVSGEPAWYDTRVAMLWDDENLYLGVLGRGAQSVGHADRTRFPHLRR